MPPLFKRRQSSPKPTQRQIEERQMVLERLQRLSQGLDPWMLIEPTIAAARTRQETYDQANNQSLQDEDYGIPTADTFDEDNTQRNFIEDGGEEFNALAEWLPAVKLGDIDNTAKTKLVLPVLTDQIAEHNEAPQAVDGGNNADADDVVEMLDPADVMAMLNLGAGDNNAGGNTDNNNVNP
ncbi:hypothetical protein PCASD_07597 [Puccinia coronata f. sp. avenae]|uniref:Uncharacterized protein n=1 Tax=Puccinia coronata f. sp. avenae TaxID=200324 RepID=A0A2N5TGM4_9BASI|nr:hypothetical protein PCASD_07597 [Puccinia coronata f. sp. avenae]